MNEPNETNVVYRALADFAAIRKELASYRRSLAATKKAEDAFNASANKNRDEAIKAANARVKTSDSETKALKKEAAERRKVNNLQDKSTKLIKSETAERQKAAKERVRFVEGVGAVNQATGEVVKSTDRLTKATGRWASTLNRAQDVLRRFGQNAEAVRKAQESLNTARLRQTEANERVRLSEIRLSNAVKRFGSDSSQAVIAQTRLDRAVRNSVSSAENYRQALARLRSESRGTSRAMASVTDGTSRVSRGLQKVGNWRPRLTPPFIALIPIIGSVIAALNPLVALLGSVGTAAFGLASNIASLSGAFLALPGILAAVAGGIGSVVASMGGVGNVFKTYSAMQKAVNSGRSNENQTDRAEALADAEYNLGKAQKNVRRAQEDLNRARKEALRDLVALRLEVSRAALNEEEAIANLTLAREEYNNVMADPGSTKGDKQRAAADVKRAEADLADVRKQNKENQEALNKAEKAGVENSEKVKDAKENLADANRSVMLAERGIRDARKGDAQVVKTTNEYQKALDDLSPSARAFALAIIGMQDQWKAFRNTVQESFFSGFVDELDRLPSLLSTLQRFLVPSARAMGRFTGALMRMLDSPEWKRDLAKIGDSNAVIIDNLGKAFLNIATALKDITVAAIPFTEWLTGAFADGTETFKEFVETGRESGSLADWLEKVRGRLEKWWKIIKNIGATLFNYGAASSEFGDWLSDGLLSLTEDWRTASQDARKEGSPWQEYLEDLKPLLSEVNGLFGDFFGWLRDEMMDPDNIQGAIDLLKVIRDDLGPALGKLLDTLAKTDIDVKFVQALSSIIESIDTMLENGGGAAFETFFEVVEGFFAGLADVMKQIPEPILKGLLSLLGFLAAASFVGKFTGLTALLGKLPGAVDNFKKAWDYVSKIDKAKFKNIIGKKGVVAALGVLAAAAIVAPAVQEGVEGVGNINSARDKYNKGDYKGYKEDLTKDGGVVKDAFGGFSIATTILDFFGLEEVSEGLDEWTSGLSGWVVDELPKFFAKLSIGWQHGWEAISAWFDSTFVVPVQDAWNGFVQFWTLDVPKFFARLGVSFRLGWAAVQLWFDQKFVQPIKNAWQRFINFWTIDVPRFFGRLGVSFRLGWAAVQLWFDQKFVQPIKNAWQRFINFWTIDVPKFFTRVGTAFRVGWTVISTWFDQKFATPIKTTFNNAFKWIDTNVFGPFKTAGANLQTAFTKVRDGLGVIWSGIQNKFKDPINFVINQVYNNGIRKFWNGVADMLGLKSWKLAPAPLIGGTPSSPKNGAAGKKDKNGRPINKGQFAKGGVLPGYTPGRDVHKFQSPTGGILELSGGEAIMRPEWTRAVGGPKAVEEMNRKARTKYAYANGGVFPGGKQSFAGGGVFDFFKNPASYITSGMKNLISGPLNNFASKSPYNKMLGAMPGQIISKLANFAAKNASASTNDSGYSGGENLGWAKQWRIIKSALPWVQMTGRPYRPGDPRSRMHSIGRAIDLTPSMAVFNWIKENYPNSQALIYSPAGNQQLFNGRNYRWGEPERSMHYSHVHWAMKNGGVVPNLYDNGGWLQHGQMGINLTGKPEAVLDPDESRALKSLLNFGNFGSLPTLSPQAPVRPNLSGTAGADYSVHIGEYNVHNPVPEKASDSLPNSIRRVAYMNAARGR